MNIRFVPQDEIDRLKWDSCVHYAHNGNPFAYAWYLNNIAKEWDGLVEDEYHSVMPLIHRKNKTGQMELYQPALIPFSGVYSVRLMTQSRMGAFLDAIPSFYKKIEIKTPNLAFKVQDLDKGFDSNAFDNHQLLLDQGLDQIQAHYTESTIKLLQSVENSGLYPGQSPKIEVLSDLYLKWSTDKQRSKKVHAYQRILYNVMHRGNGFNPVIQNQNGDICAAGAFMYSHGKIFCLLYTQKPDSEGELAGAYLHHLLIEKHTGNPLILDFNTGSGNHWGHAFGAKAVPHHHIIKNQLPWWSKILG